jgi:hypothetical protein
MAKRKMSTFERLQGGRLNREQRRELGQKLHSADSENGEQARSGFVDSAGEAACWKPTVERLFNELNRLDERTYAEWDTKRLEEIVALGFHGAGLIPIPISGGLRVNFR